MKNPNAIAAWIAAHAVIGVEQLVQRYTHHALPTFWEQEAIADTTTVVLYIGHSGVKAALNRAWQTIRRVWAGHDTATPKATAAK